MLAAQNICLAAESEGLGICFLGTTIYNADRIAEVLRLPEGVLPVTTVTLGWPEEMPPLTDRLPLEGVVHRERYEDYTPETIDRIWAEREASPETAELLRANGLPNLARIFTERRYTAEDNRLFSRKYFDMLKKQGFFQSIGSGCPPQRAFPGRSATDGPAADRKPTKRDCLWKGSFRKPANC